MMNAKMFSNTPNCDCPPTRNSPEGACRTQDQRVFSRGQLPIVIPICPGDLVTMPGRINAAWVPEFVVEEFFARGAAYAPAAPLSDTDTYTDTPVTLTLAPSAGVAALTPGFVIDLMTSNNVSPGVSTIAFTGVFEGGGAYTQTIQVSTMRVGVSRFVVLGTREVQGGAYPNLISIANAAIIGVTPTPSNVTYTAALSATFESVPGTSIRLETLSPVSELWFQAVDRFYATAQPYYPRRNG